MDTLELTMRIDEVAYKLAIATNVRRERTRPLLHSYLMRPFPSKATHRILLTYQADELAEPQFLPFLRYGREFEKAGIHFRAQPIAQTNGSTLIDDATALFVQGPYDHTDPTLRDYLAYARTRRPDLVISFFDWAAPADLRFAEQISPYVDHYVKKSVLRDRSFYLRPSAGHTNLTDYYASKKGTPNPPRDWAMPSDIVKKLTVGPSFSTSSRLIHRFEGARPKSAEKIIDVHARIAVKGTPWYQVMRGEALSAVREQLNGLTVASEGLVPRRQYAKELAQSHLCFSPFGYGEICWRDFEAVALGSVLIKPDMSHLEAWPNLYVSGETYIPVRWDFSDLGSTVRALLADEAERQRLTTNAFDAVRRHLADGSLLDFVRRLLHRHPV